MPSPIQTSGSQLFWEPLLDGPHRLSSVHFKRTYTKIDAVKKKFHPEVDNNN